MAAALLATLVLLLALHLIDPRVAETLHTVHGRANTMAHDELAILTFNAGLFDLRFFGISFVKPADFLQERLTLLPQALASVPADVVALQEVFEERHQLFLSDRLRDVFPHVVRTRARGLRFGPGLMFLSKLPVRTSGFRRFRDQGPLDERLITQRGLLFAVVEAGVFGQIALVNVHPTSGGFLHAQDEPRVLEMREAQIQEALEFARESTAQLTAILGDFNTGPQIAPADYEFLLRNGFVDAFAQVCEQRGECQSVTWDARNPLNVRGTHPDSISQRIDHIYLPRSSLTNGSVLDARIVLDEALVPVGNPQEKVTVSDHYGLLVTLQPTPVAGQLE